MDSPDAERLRALAGIGYLLLIAGFAATFMPGLIGYGFLMIWIGCGLGLQGAPNMRWGGGFAIGLMLSGVGVTIGSGFNQLSDDLEWSQAYLVVTVQSVEYRAGELRVVGSVENTGVGAAFSPAIELAVYDASGERLLAAETAYPGGTHLADHAPGEVLPFEHLAFVLGEPEEIRWLITVEDYPGEVVRHGLVLGPPVLLGSGSSE